TTGKQTTLHSIYSIAVLCEFPFRKRDLQLQFRTETASQGFPFGKYKGQPIAKLVRDVDYAKWLIEQSWFKNHAIYS
ncbi:hypothetical protein OEK97_28855, partial [Escherichia coli]